MKTLVNNVNFTIRISLSMLIIFGLWAPNHYSGVKKWLYNIYTFFSCMFFVGFVVIGQIVDLFQVWGNIPLMTATMCLVFTNLAFTGKILTVILRKREIQNMIDEVNQELVTEVREEGKNIVRSCDKETRFQMIVFFSFTYMTILGWASSADKNQLPIRAWFPYDTSKTPAYQITYAYQCMGAVLGASLNISLDTLMTSLICQCRCRLRLLALSMTILCEDLPVNEQGQLVRYGEEIVAIRLRECIKQHQAALEQARLLQVYFSAPIFGQFSISMIINCVTAYQLAFESSSLLRFMSMVTYLAGILLQVFFYCYQGNELLNQSEKIRGAAYAFPWYHCSVPVRRALLVLIIRTHRVIRLRAGGLAELSLETFMAILKTSYSFFTVLQQIGDKN